MDSCEYHYDQGGRCNLLAKQEDEHLGPVCDEHFAFLNRIRPKEADMTTAARIEKVCDDLKAMLLAKNAAYGDSATSPLRIFSKADHLEGIRVRVDDKLSRLSRGTPYPGDNDVLDLVGYLILFLSMQEESNECADIAPPSIGKECYLDCDGDLWTKARDGRYSMGSQVKDHGVATLNYLERTYGPSRTGL